MHDIQYATVKPSRRRKQLKRIGRHQVNKRDCAVHCKMQTADHAVQVDAYIDSNWRAGNNRGRVARPGALLMGQHLLESWSNS